MTHASDKGMFSLVLQTCPECGGAIVLRAEHGRMRSYRGASGYEIPAEMALPTCERCGRTWLDTTMVRELGEVFERERQKREKSS